MRDIIYDVAVSLDGFIAAKGGDASAFPHSGEHVTAYGERLQTYDTVIMGRKTYEYAYDFGLPPGARAYPHMKHYIFSKTLELPDKSDVEAVRDNWIDKIDTLKSSSGGPIYLCGGGIFAGYLMQHGRIDLLRLKIAPLILGNGIKLFSGLTEPAITRLKTSRAYENGVSYQEHAAL